MVVVPQVEVTGVGDVLGTDELGTGTGVGVGTARSSTDGGGTTGGSATATPR